MGLILAGDTAGKVEELPRGNPPVGNRGAAATSLQPAERRSVQRAIFAVQHNLEQIYENRLAPGQVLLCDRGSPDGGGYWPEGHERFFEELSTDWHRELQRYDAVLFMESAAVGGLTIDANNITRHEDHAAA